MNDTPADKLRKQLARIDAELNERLAQIDAEADKGRVECWYNPPGPAGGADVALRGKLVLVSGDRVACVRLSQALNGFTPIDGPEETYWRQVEQAREQRRRQRLASYGTK